MFLLSNWGIIWVMNCALSIFLLILLTDWISFCIILSLGSLLSILTYSIIFGAIHFPSDPSITYMTIYVIVFSILIGIIFARRKEKNSNEQIKIARLLGGTIAHEMRTFIMTIENYIYGMNKYFPVLIQGYDLASKNNLVTTSIPSTHFRIISEYPSDVHTALKKASCFINLLLINIKESLPMNNHDDKFGNFMILSCIEDAINSYPFTIQEKNYLNIIKKNDFAVIANKEIITHVLFNLISNSLYYIFNKQNAKIKIWTSSNKYYNFLSFYDNGPGIDKKDLEIIFERFYSKSKKGTGLGLSFCKYAMKSIGGDIACSSSKGRFTKFIMTFPK
jgi:signal transduction histidine kinase